ncbi:DUF1800 family protein [Winogradskyella sp.]|uniref:DUF1800 domain-containing protein n=1 Tax=Winogradskyella sp. TaxID=1883156 RepID=UPI0037038C5B
MLSLTDMTPMEFQHLYWRAGFGIQPNIYASTSKKREDVVSKLFEASKVVSPLQIDLSYLDKIHPNDIRRNPGLAREVIEKNKKKIISLNYASINRLMYPKELLRERMTLFWMNHFVCRDHNPKYVQQFNNTIRYFALGDFRAFVKAISKEAAMLRYLDGKLNRKHKPNENFSRELMELFTLGEGHYSEKNIKEAARAFTGYNHNFNGEFLFREFQHDNTFKSFFGETGNFSGDDIIDIILKNQECARFISEKIYRYFVNPVPNKTHIEAMTSVFFKDYNIASLMRFVFMSDWFYDANNIGSKIKSPMDLLVGITNTVPIKFEREKDLMVIQKILGQMLLNPPNVGGWKGDRGWIDANTIMVRLKLPSLLLNNAIISLKEQGDFNDNFRHKYFKRNLHKLPFKTLPDWDEFLQKYDNVATKDLHDYILQGKLNNGTANYLEKLSKKSKQDYCIQIMSLPEYQMC